MNDVEKSILATVLGWKNEVLHDLEFRHNRALKRARLERELSIGVRWQPAYWFDLPDDAALRMRYTRCMQAMVAAGLLEANRDGRVTYLRLTPLGESIAVQLAAEQLAIEVEAG